MATGTISLELPPRMYERLREISNERNSPMQAVMVEMLAPFLDPTTADVDVVLEEMDGYPDKALWEIVYQRLTMSERRRLDDLIEKGKQGARTPAEDSEVQALLDQVERQMLLRSKALALLVERGYDIQSRFRDGEWVRE